MVTMSRHGRGRSRSQPRSVDPSTSSIATNAWSPVRSTSNTVTTFGWASRAIACASKLIRAASALADRLTVGRSTLSATLRSSAGS